MDFVRAHLNWVRFAEVTVRGARMLVNFICRFCGGMEKYMNKKILTVVAVVVAVALFAGAYFLYDYLSDRVDVEDPTLTETGETTGEIEEDNKFAAPDFNITDADGNTVSLSDFKGKPVVLNFWASWCDPCKSEMPHFEAAYKADTDVEFMMVNVTSGDTKRNAEKLIADKGYTFPVYYDVDGTVSKTYAASPLPTTYFIDSEGYFVTYAVGALSAERLDAYLDLLK